MFAKKASIALLTIHGPITITKYPSLQTDNSNYLKQYHICTHGHGMPLPYILVAMVAQ